MEQQVMVRMERHQHMDIQMSGMMELEKTEFDRRRVPPL